MTTIPSAPNGSVTSSQLELFPPDAWTSDPSPMSSLRISEASDNAISSLGSAAGPMPSSLPAGPLTDLFGLQAFPASPIPAQDSGAAPLMNEISGQFSFGWSSSADPTSFSASKSLPPTLSGALLNRTRTCRTCSTAKPSSEFYVNSKGHRRRVCKDCDREAERKRKRANPDLTHDRHRKWRRDYRGHALVNVAKNRAKSRGIPFDLSPLDIQKRIDAGHCELTGIAFNLDEPRAWNAPSLDQRKPGAGYTRDNVRVVLHALNVMANVWGENRIVEIANAITARRVERSNDLSRAIGDRLKAQIDLNGSPEFEMTWTEVVTPLGHVLPRLVASARRISGRDCSGWRTPQTLDGERGPALNADAKAGQHSLTTEAQLAGWPTPVSNDDNKSVEAHLAMKSRMGGNRTAITSLQVMAQTAGWPTPTRRDHKDAASTLENTPVNGLLGRQVQASGAMPSGSPASTEKRGALNAAFSLWLQGYPSLWMDSAPSAASVRSGAQATLSRRKRPPSSSKP